MLDQKVRAVPKPIVKTVKRCVLCGWEELVAVRKKNCPECGKRGSLEKVEGGLQKLRERPCECGCGRMVIAPKKYVSGHNARVPGNIYREGRPRGYKKIRCSECGEKFERRIDQINRRSLKNYCSNDCSNKAHARKRKGQPLLNARTGEYRRCKNCRKRFYLSPSQAKKKEQGKFCSHKCRNAWNVENGYMPKGFIGSADNAGEKNGRYKHGRRIGGHISKKKVREKVIERDGGEWCLFCGKPGPGLHLHRILYGSQGGKYEVDNCVQLCPVHHELVHTSKRKWKPILQRYIETREEQWVDML